MKQIIKNKHFTIYFGDVSESISLDEIAQQKSTYNLQSIAEQINVVQLIFLQQEHGIQGFVIDKDDAESQFFVQPGDCLITQKKDCGIGIVTADCLPIVLYDPTTHTAAIVHAGWKGALAGILIVAIKNMIASCNVSVADIHIYFGPAARPCCYEVQSDFVDQFDTYLQSFDDNNSTSFSYKNSENFQPNELHQLSKKRLVAAATQFPERSVSLFQNLLKSAQSIFIEKNNKIYFDSTAFAAFIATNLGIKLKNIYTTYNVCTICDTSFCSFRREKEKSSRQITLISLH